MHVFKSITILGLVGLVANLCSGAVSNLRCEYLVNPLAIGTGSPRLSWIIADTERGARQTAYQVLVASSTKLLSEGTGDPVMSRAWTLLGLPSLSLPFWFEGEALPRGLQLAARPGADLQLLSFAARLAPSLVRRPL